MLGVVLNFTTLSKENLICKCEKLSKILGSGTDSDIDGIDLAQNFLSLSLQNMTVLELLYFIH